MRNLERLVHLGAKPGCTDTHVFTASRRETTREIWVGREITLLAVIHLVRTTVVDTIVHGFTAVHTGTSCMFNARARHISTVFYGTNVEIAWMAAMAVALNGMSNLLTQPVCLANPM